MSLVAMVSGPAGAVLTAVLVCVAVAGTRWIGKVIVQRVIHPVTKDMKAQVAHMAAEFSPNGGRSIKDTVTRLDQNLTKFIAYQHKRNHDVLNIAAALVAREQLRDSGHQPPPIDVDLAKLEGGPVLGEEDRT